MNERILELAVKSGHIVGSLPLNANEKIQLAGLKKFAELIVKECEQVSLKNSHRNDDMGAIIARQIRKHFGVEE